MEHEQISEDMILATSYTHGPPSLNTHVKVEDISTQM